MSFFEEVRTDTKGQNNSSRLMVVEGAESGRPIATANIPADRKLKGNFLKSGDYTVGRLSGQLTFTVTMGLYSRSTAWSTDTRVQQYLNLFRI